MQYNDKTDVGIYYIELSNEMYLPKTVQLTNRTEVGICYIYMQTNVCKPNSVYNTANLYIRLHYNNDDNMND